RSADFGGGLMEWQRLQLLSNIALPSAVFAVASASGNPDAMQEKIQRYNTFFMIELPLKINCVNKYNNPLLLFHFSDHHATDMPDCNEKHNMFHKNILILLVFLSAPLCGSTHWSNYRRYGRTGSITGHSCSISNALAENFKRILSLPKGSFKNLFDIFDSVEKKS
ncbi:MAG: hypothetical protein HGA70_10830, partial [Chlorobiaceae bacterium]|nr:hypothetical protein [Chlorobiaceae bacterium]